MQRNETPRDSRHRDDYSRDRPSGGYTGPIASTPAGIEYASPAEAEAAFHKLLRKVGVQPSWTWEQAVRSSIQDPTFRALKEPTERKASFEKFQEDIKAQEKEREKERITKFRNDFRNMLKRHREIKSYTRWKTALPMIEDETEFRGAKDDDEKKRLFREYIHELRREQEEKRFRDHDEAVKELVDLVRDANLSPESHWEDFHGRLNSNPKFARDEKFQTLNKTEILDAFSDQMNRLWDDVNVIKQRERTLFARGQRKAREGYLDLLHQLQSEERLTPTSTWKEIHSQIEDDARYQTLLDNVYGASKFEKDSSTPQDIYFDVMEDFNKELHEIAIHVGRVMKVCWIFSRHETLP